MNLEDKHLLGVSLAIHLTVHIVTRGVAARKTSVWGADSIERVLEDSIVVKGDYAVRRPKLLRKMAVLDWEVRHVWRGMVEHCTDAPTQHELILVSFLAPCVTPA